MIVRKKQLPGNPVKNWMNPRIITTTELDYMEYSSDANAQAAYVTNTTNTSQQPPAHNDTYVKALTKWSTEFWAYFGTDPAGSLTGGWNNVCWLSVSGTNTNQTVHIDLGSAKIPARIYYENNHHIGGNTTYGVKTFTAWGSNESSAFADLTYATDTNWTQITTSQGTFDQHVGADQADPKYITTYGSTAYRYIRFKFADGWGGAAIGFRRIAIQTNPLNTHSESTIKTQGSYSLKGVAAITDSLNKTLTRTIGSPIDLTGVTSSPLKIRSNRTGSNIKVGLHDSGGTTTEATPNITDADTFQEVTVDLSGVADANKDAIDSLIFTIVNADSANTFYVDDFLCNTYSIKMYEDDPVVNAGDPIGTLLLWPTGTPPSGYLECDGSSLDRTTYALLFAVLSDDYGAVDGTHFSLPDMRGKFFRGWSHGQTTDPDKATRTDRGDTTTGDNVGTNQAHGVKAHTHTAMASASSAGSTGASSPAQNTTTDSGAYGGNETRPINIAMMCCIRYQ